MTRRPNTLQVGALRVHALHAGIQKLDGGAMFGVVPKPLWTRRIAADDRNRITLAMRPLLVEHDDGLILIDSGLGNKEPARFREIYGVDNEAAGGRTWLEDSLAVLGFQPSDVKKVVNTHLHFDHAGGNTYVAADDEERRAQVSFPKARYLVHRRELEYARGANERTQASYLEHNWVPVQEAGQLDLLDGHSNIIAPGVRMIVTPGHTPWHMSALIENGGEALFFPADTIPTAHHLPLPWIMGYDVEPLRTLSSKRTVLGRAVERGWRVVFEHDDDDESVGGRLVAGERPGECRLERAE